MFPKDVAVVKQIKYATTADNNLLEWGMVASSAVRSQGKGGVQSQGGV